MSLTIDRRTTLVALAGSVLSGCGGGGGGSSPPVAAAPPLPPAPPPAPPGNLWLFGAVAPQTTPLEAVVAWGDLLAGAVVSAPDNCCFEPTYPPMDAAAAARAFLAGHDALNAIQRRYRPFAYAPVPDASADARLAFGTAVYLTLKGRVSTNSDGVLQQAYDTMLALVPAGTAATRSIEIGRASAEAVDAALSERPSFDVSWALSPPLPGRFRFDSSEAEFASVNPAYAGRQPLFAAAGGDQFLTEPHALGSSAYAADFDEVLRLGATASTARTAAQSQVATFWTDNPVLKAQEVATARLSEAGLDAWGAARALALLHVAIADAYTLAMEAAARFDRWEPAHAIREADLDGNPATQAVAQWQPLIDLNSSSWQTPSRTIGHVPAYPSHDVAVAAAWTSAIDGLVNPPAGTLTGRRTSGRNGGDTWNQPMPTPRSGESAWQAVARDVGESRIWAGLNMRDAVDAGASIGRMVAVRALQRLPAAT